MARAILGGGCFWCVEAVYQRLYGVISVVPGYAGGKSKTTTYKEVVTGTTGHAEVAKIEYDSSIITFEQILNVFWQAHDPTTLNRQGNDVGTQYRSVIFYHNDKQKSLALESIKKADASEYWSNKIEFSSAGAECPGQMSMKKRELMILQENILKLNKPITK